MGTIPPTLSLLAASCTFCFSCGDVLPEAPTGGGPQLGWCLWSVCLSLELSHYSPQNLEAGQLRVAMETHLSLLASSSIS